jgi:hypothetical protein
MQLRSVRRESFVASYAGLSHAALVPMDRWLAMAVVGVANCSRYRGIMGDGRLGTATIWGRLTIVRSARVASWQERGVSEERWGVLQRWLKKARGC